MDTVRLDVRFACRCSPVTNCDDVMLRNYDAKNDFTQAGLDELCEQYAVC